VAAYQKGQSVALSVAFTDAAGAPANPTTVRCKVEKPDGTETTYTSASTPAVTNPSTGTFQVIIPADQSGMWVYRWEGDTGTTLPRDEELFHVLGSVFA
jgi:hypothetical protein